MSVQIEDLLFPKIRLKIIKTCVKNSLITIGQLVKKVKSNHGTITYHLKYLQDMGVIEIARYERLVLISMKKNTLADHLATFISKFED